MTTPSDPFDAVPRESPDGLDTRRRWARALPFARLAEVPWLGRTVRVRMGVPAAAPAPSTQPAVGVLLERGASRFAWAWSPALAGLVLERSLGGETGEPLHGPLGEMERGVLTYAVARWFAQSSTPNAWEVAGVFAHAPALHEALGSGAFERWPLTLALGEESFETHLLLNPGLPAPPASTGTADDLPVTCEVHAGVATLPAGEVRTLAPGDVVLPDALSVDAMGEGPVRIQVRGATLSIEAVRASGQLTVKRRVQGERVHVSPGGSDMSGSIEGMERLPVTLSVELGRFALPLADVAALAPGEVVKTGASMGDEVVLRAGDQVVATGELVLIGDEVGVRLVEVPTRR